MVAFDDGTQATHTLDGKTVSSINSNLTAAADTTAAVSLADTANLSFSGTKKAGDFNITETAARELLGMPNPHGKPNSDVLKPWLNGTAIVQRPDRQWIIDCGVNMMLEDFLLYEGPHHHALAQVKPARDKNKREVRRVKWWLHAELAPAMRTALSALDRFIATPRVSKHRIFTWNDPVVLPDDGIFIFARADDLFFGVLHSHIHEVWSLAQGTQVREKESGFRYTPSTCFETFPFPAGVIESTDPLPATHAAIAAAAKELNELRENWLNPPEWTREEVIEFPGTVGGPWDRFIDTATASDRGAFKVGTVRYPHLVPRDATSAGRLKERTLTKLYNVRPAWLAACHAKLDAAVAAAYGWPADLTEEVILERLLALNHGTP